MPGCWVVADCCWDPDPIPAVGNAHRGDQGRGNSLAHLATAVLGFSPREDSLLYRAPTNPPARRLYLQPPTELGSTEPNLLAASRLPRPCRARIYPRASRRTFGMRPSRTLDQDSSKCRGGTHDQQPPQALASIPARVRIIHLANGLTAAEFYRIISEMRQFYEFFITEILLHATVSDSISQTARATTHLPNQDRRGSRPCCKTARPQPLPPPPPPARPPAPPPRGGGSGPRAGPG
jgi:hypothetical protein